MYKYIVIGLNDTLSEYRKHTDPVAYDDAKKFTDASCPDFKCKIVNEMLADRAIEINNLDLHK